MSLIIDSRFTILIREMLDEINAAKDSRAYGRYDMWKLNAASMKLNELIEACQSDELLLKYVATQNIAARLMELTKVYHSGHLMDIACLKMLELLVRTEEGFDLIATKEYLIQNWENSCKGLRSFCFAAQGLVTAFREMQKTCPIVPGSLVPLDQIHPELADETYFTKETLRLCGYSNSSSIGILFAPNDDFGLYSVCRRSMLYQRLRTLPILCRKSKSALLHLFPKCCPGCLALNIFSAGEVLKDYQLTTSVINELRTMNGNHGRYLNEYDVTSLCKSTFTYFSRGESESPDECPYPYMGNCLDYRKNQFFVDRMVSLGNNLIGSPSKSLRDREQRESRIFGVERPSPSREPSEYGSRGGRGVSGEENDDDSEESEKERGVKYK